MAAKIIIDGKEFDLGIRALTEFANSLSDYPQFRGLFDHLALTQPSEIRAMMAYKDNISPNVVKVLLQDKSVEVLRAAVRNIHAKKEISTEELIALINLDDRELTDNIINSIEEYENADPLVVSEHIISLNNKQHLHTLADYRYVPKKVLKLLSKNSDPDIQSAALRSLD
jgi:hypothetical protein